MHKTFSQGEDNVFDLCLCLVSCLWGGGNIQDWSSLLRSQLKGFKQLHVLFRLICSNILFNLIHTYGCHFTRHALFLCLQLVKTTFEKISFPSINSMVFDAVLGIHALVLKWDSKLNFNKLFCFLCLVSFLWSTAVLQIIHKALPL